MKTKRLFYTMIVCGLLLILSIAFAIFQIAMYLNFWWLLLPLLMAAITTYSGIKWTRYVQSDPKKAINDLK